MKVRNTFIIFLVSGFWHGANWTFIVWGFLNALYIMPSIIFNTNRDNLDIVAKGKYFPTLREAFMMCLTFGLSVFAWIFFRAENVGHALKYINNMFSHSLFTLPKGSDFIRVEGHPFVIFSLMSLFILIEWLGREGHYAIYNLGLRWKKPLRYALYYIIIVAILFFNGEEQQFIYFQF